MEKNFEHIHPAYTLVSSEYIDEVKSQAAMLVHNKTGARVAVLSNEDKNKVFNIIFRTPPKDSTGVPHILEHPCYAVPEFSCKGSFCRTGQRVIKYIFKCHDLSG